MSFRRQKEDITMTAAGQISYLPVLSPVRSVLRQYSPAPHHYGARHKWQDRLYRMPPQERRSSMTYYPNGDAAPERVNGVLIDLYV